MSQDADKDKAVPFFEFHDSHFNQFEDIHIEGHKQGFLFTNSDNNTFKNITGISDEALRIIEEIHIQSNDLISDEAIRNELHKMLDRIKQKQDMQSKLQIYTDFMSTVADHMTILSPLMPAIMSLFKAILG